MASKDSEPKPAIKLTLEEINKRATSGDPFFKLTLTTSSYLCYMNTVTLGLGYGPEETLDSQTVALKIVKLSKEGGSDQAGYVISSHKNQENWLQVTEQNLKSNEREVKFLPPKQPQTFYQSQLFQLQADPKSSTTFAFYTTMVDSKGQNKVYYLKPESGTIVAEESSSPDGHYCFSLSAYPSAGFAYNGTPLTANKLLQKANSNPRTFLVKVNSTGHSLYLLTGGTYLMRYRTVNTSDISFVMTMTSTDGSNPVEWSNTVTPPYLFMVRKSGTTYASEFMPNSARTGSAYRFNVVSLTTTPTLLAFTTTITTRTTKHLYLDTNARTGSVTVTPHTVNLPAAAYMFNAFEVTSVTVPANIITKDPPIGPPVQNVRGEI